MVTTRHSASRQRGEEPQRASYAEMEHGRGLKQEEAPMVASEEDEEGAAPKKKGGAKKAGAKKSAGKKRAHAAPKAGGKGRGRRPATRREEESEEGEEVSEEPKAKAARTEEPPAGEEAVPEQEAAAEEAQPMEQGKEAPAPEQQPPPSAAAEEEQAAPEPAAAEEAAPEPAPAEPQPGAMMAQEKQPQEAEQGVGEGVQPAEEQKEPHAEVEAPGGEGGPMEQPALAAGEKEKQEAGQEEAEAAGAGDEEEGPGEEGMAPGGQEEAPLAAEKQEAPAPEQAAHKAAPSVPGTVEEGRIFFFYRPKVGREHAGSLFDVQRFYMVLDPHGQGKTRLAVVGKKRLPDVQKHERFFGFIEATSDSLQDLTPQLGPDQYGTATRGSRHLAGARALGEGAYSIVDRTGSRSGGGRTNLVFKMEVPAHPGHVQDDFCIPSEGSYVLSVKNPANEPAGGYPLGLEHKADFSEEKLKEFGDFAWIGVADPSLLDYERCEFLLVGTSDAPQQELGEAGAAVVHAAQQDVRTMCPNNEEECMLEAMRKELRAEDVGIETGPAATGEWQ